MKKEIDFDFEKFGQEGVEAFIDGVRILTTHKFPSGYPDRYYGIDVRGMTYDRHKSKLVMIEEIKPREIWVNEYPTTSYKNSCIYESKEAAFIGSGKTANIQTKFREVLDDEQ